MPHYKSKALRRGGPHYKGKATRRPALDSKRTGWHRNGRNSKNEAGRRGGPHYKGKTARYRGEKKADILWSSSQDVSDVNRPQPRRKRGSIP